MISLRAVDAEGSARSATIAVGGDVSQRAQYIDRASSAVMWPFM